MTPLLLGHRGARACRNIPENTLASFELCLKHGCDGFEFDVRRAADGAAVICHDSAIRGLRIAQTSAADLNLPTLEQVLQQFSSRAFLDIELKIAGLERLTVAELQRNPPVKGYVVSSFLPEVLSTIHDLDRAIPLGLLCEKPGQLRCWQESAAEWMIPRSDLVTATLVDEVHAAGKKIMVWTVNRAEQIEMLARAGVDAIISDDTELLVRIVATAGNRD